MANENLMHFLDAIAQRGSISKAANSLFVTQPYISQTINHYEQKFGLKLIDRKKKPLQLTYAGERLLNYLRQQENQYTALKNEMAQLAKFDHGEIVIATNQPLGRTFFPQLLPAFQKQFPEIRTRLLELPTDQAEKLLLTGEINFFIGMPIYNKKLTYQRLTTANIYLLVPATSKLFDPTQNYPPIFPYAVETLNHQRFIKIRSDSRYQEMLDHFFIDHGVVPQITTEVANMDIAARLAFEQIGCTFIVAQVLQQNLAFPNQKLNVFQMPHELLSTDVGICYKKEINIIEPIKLLIKLAEENLQTVM